MELFCTVTSAMERHAEVTEQLRDAGWHTEQPTEPTVRVIGSIWRRAGLHPEFPPYHVEDQRVQMPVGRDDAAIALEPASSVEIERSSIEISDAASRLFDGQRTCRMIPDALAVIGAGWNPHEKIGAP